MVKANDDVSSTITEDELEHISQLAEFPPGAELVAPGDEDRPELTKPGYVVYYEYPFLLGFKFGLTELVRKILHSYDLSPGQLLPSVWRICAMIEKHTSRWEQKIDLKELLGIYGVKKTNLGRVTLKAKSANRKLVEEEGVNDRGWKARFFFVEKSSLGEAGEWVRGGWMDKDLELLPDSEPDFDLIDSFLSIPVDQRTFPKSAPPPCLLPVESTMTSASTRKTVDDAELKKRALERKRKRDGGAELSETQSLGRSMMPPPKSTPPQSKVQIIPVESTRLSMPSDFLAGESVSSGIFPIAEKLLFPAASHRLKTLDALAVHDHAVGYQLQALQNVLFTRNLAREADEDRRKTRHEMRVLDAAYKQLRLQFDQHKAQYDKEMEELRTTLQQENEKKIAELQQEVERLTSEVQGIEAETTIFVRAKVAHGVIMKEFDDSVLKGYMDDYIGEFGSMADLQNVVGGAVSQEADKPLLPATVDEMVGDSHEDEAMKTA